MFGTPIILVGLAGAALVLASATPALVRHGPNSPAVHTRGDRLAIPKVIDRAPVTTIEIWGLSNARVVLRDHKGELLYLSNPATGTTFVARGAEIPRLVFRPAGGAPDAPVGADPVAREPAGGGGGTNTSPMPVGCEGRVSPLASPEAHRIARLCLASLGLRERS